MRLFLKKEALAVLFAICCFHGSLYTPIVQAVSPKIGENPDSLKDTDGGPGTSQTINNSGRNEGGSPKLYEAHKEGVNTSATAANKPESKSDPSVVTIDEKSLTDALSTVYSNLGNVKIPPTKLDKTVGGLSVLLDIMHLHKDIDIMFRAIDAVNKYSLNVKPGESRKVVVSSTDGVINITSYEGYSPSIIKSPSTRTITTVISGPPLFYFESTGKSKEQQEQEYKEWLRSLDSETRKVLEKEKSRIESLRAANKKAQASVAKPDAKPAVKPSKPKKQPKSMGEE
jgi:hypothetical protein